MRPDAISWQNARDLSALEFTPRKLTYHKISVWFMVALASQAALTLVLWCAFQGTLRETIASLSPDPRGAAPATIHQAIFKAIASYQFLLLLAAQVVALVAVELVFVARFRVMLRKQTTGLAALFQGIRDMACGVMPKPLPAGLSGEVGYLTLAFNDMVGRVAASKSALVEANQLLERRVVERTSELSEALLKMEQMASTDALTGLFNRRCLTHEFCEAFEQARDRSTELVCAAIDLDGFKGVNDQLGHQTGDQIIKLAASVLRANCRATDLVARLGGDEFLVVMTQVEMAQAVQITERLQAEFQRQAAELLAGKPLSRMPSMSIGLTSRLDAKAKSLDELISQADTALYTAKENGKARVETFRKAA